MFLLEQRAVTMLCQRPLFAAVLLAVVQVMLASLSSSSTNLLKIFTLLPTFLHPCEADWANDPPVDTNDY